MGTGDWVKLNRDVLAVMIPAGTRTNLPAGTEVMITQSLGGSHTVQTMMGMLVRVDGKDADALGLPVERVLVEDPSQLTDEEIKERIWNQMKTVYDPEIPVNIVDLGLIYVCEMTPHPEGGKKVEVVMSLTAPGCGMGDVLKRDVEQKILNVPGVHQAEVQVTFDPPWGQDRMSEAAKLQLGLM